MSSSRKMPTGGVDLNTLKASEPQDVINNFMGAAQANRGKVLNAIQVRQLAGIIQQVFMEAQELRTLLDYIDSNNVGLVETAIEEVRAIIEEEAELEEDEETGEGSVDAEAVEGEAEVQPETEASEEDEAISRAESEGYNVE